jgi:hypothetical protein
MLLHASTERSLAARSLSTECAVLGARTRPVLKRFACIAKRLVFMAPQEQVGAAQRRVGAARARAIRPLSIACELAYLSLKPAKELTQALHRDEVHHGCDAAAAPVHRVRGRGAASETHGAQMRLGAERGEAGIRARRAARRTQAVPDPAHCSGAREPRDQPGVRAVSPRASRTSPVPVLPLNLNFRCFRAVP